MMLGLESNVIFVYILHICLIPHTVEHPVNLRETTWNQDIFLLKQAQNSHIYSFFGQRNLSARRCTEFVHICLTEYGRTT